MTGHNIMTEATKKHRKRGQIYGLVKGGIVEEKPSNNIDTLKSIGKNREEENKAKNLVKVTQWKRGKKYKIRQNNFII